MSEFMSSGCRTPVKINKAKNPLWPLPRDYDGLTEEGKRQARVNACRQWLLPSATGVDFAACVNFFDKWYLWPDPEAEFFPGFYDMDPLPSPPFHDILLTSWFEERATLAICPRGSAKSTLLRKKNVLKLLTRPSHSTLYVTSTVQNAEKNGQAIRDACFENERVQADWSVEPEFDGSIKPGRGLKPVGMSNFYLKNGSNMLLTSVDSGIRGGRMYDVDLDDPEREYATSTSPGEKRRNLERLLFNVLRPMLQRPGTRQTWTATFVSYQHYAWSAMETQEAIVDGKVTRLAKDERFNHWRRIIIAAMMEHGGVLQSCWPEMWPVDETERARLNLPKETVTLRAMREEDLGPSVFDAEMMATPRRSEDSYFGLLDKRRHGYEYKDVDGPMGDNPRASTAKICYAGQEQVMQKFLDSAYVFVVGDTAFTHGPNSDFKAVATMAITPKNDLVVLDLWAGKVPESKLVEVTFQMAARWRAKHVWAEAVKQGFTYLNAMKNAVSRREKELMGGSGWVPGVRRVNIGTVPKEAKIGALRSRFEHGKIFLPLYLAQRQPWRMLFEQIERFNPDVQGGGLQNDDCLDVVSMSEFIVKSRPTADGEEAKPVLTPIEHLKEGHAVDEKTGLPWGSALDLTKVSVADILQVLDRHYEKVQQRPSGDSLA